MHLFIDAIFYLYIIITNSLINIALSSFSLSNKLPLKLPHSKTLLKKKVKLPSSPRLRIEKSEIVNRKIHKILLSKKSFVKKTKKNVEFIKS